MTEGGRGVNCCARFTVTGLPVPQGSKRAIVNRHTGKPAVIESGATRLRPWRALVADAAQQAGVVPVIDAVRISLTFRLPRPKSRRRAAHVDRRPDLDKLIRAVLDALTGVAWWDDAQVVSLNARKRYAAEAESPGLDAQILKAMG